MLEAVRANGPRHLLVALPRLRAPTVAGIPVHGAAASVDAVCPVSDTALILTIKPARAEVEMGTITPYETVKGRRYRVRYRKPDHAEAEKRGFTTMRDAQQYPYHGYGVEVEGRVHRSVVVASAGPDVRRQLTAIKAAADVALLLHDARAGMEEPRRSRLGRQGDLHDPAF